MGQALDSLFSDPREMTEHWESRAFVSSPAAPPAHLLATFDVDRHLRSSGLRAAYVRLFRDGHSLDPAGYLQPASTGLPDLVDAEAVIAAVAAGATLSLIGLRLFDEQVRNLCEQLSDEVGIDIYANCYLTPPHATGAGVHFDGHSVVLHQVEGRKRWLVWAPRQLWPAEPYVGDGSRPERDPVLDVVLEPGQSLYIPRGFLHDGHTLDVSSLHVTFSFGNPVTWAAQIADLLATRLRSVDELRQTLPPHLTADRQDAQAAERLHAARCCLASIPIAELLAEMRPGLKRRTPPGSLTEALNGADRASTPAVHPARTC